MTARFRHCAALLLAAVLIVAAALVHEIVGRIRREAVAAAKLARPATSLESDGLATPGIPSQSKRHPRPRRNTPAAK